MKKIKTRNKATQKWLLAQKTDSLQPLTIENQEETLWGRGWGDFFKANSSEKNDKIGSG